MGTSKAEVGGSVPAEVGLGETRTAGLKSVTVNEKVTTTMYRNLMALTTKEGEIPQYNALPMWMPVERHVVETERTVHE